MPKNNAPQVIAKMTGICKYFVGVKALDDVSFTLHSGEVLALLGENGAGKSTLMKILSGVYSKDEGEIELFGSRLPSGWNPVKARELGVAIIHQELNMCSHLSIVENIFLGRELIKNGVLDEKNMYAQTMHILDTLGMRLDPNTVVGTLSVSKQQMVEIARALLESAKILIMDEPTSALSSKEIDELFTIIKKLKSEGKGIVYISHRLDELKHIVDRAMIMRDGHYITEMPYEEARLDEIIAHMVGREIKEKFPYVACNRGRKIFEVKNLCAGKMVRDVSIDLYEGEMVGIAGLMGAGRTETTRAIFGIDLAVSGELLLDGKQVKISKPTDAIRNGVVLAPENRKKDGLCTRLSVAHNIVLPNLDMLCNVLGAINRKKEHEMVEKAIQDLHIKLANSDADANSLSGGNQQKVVVAKWLARTSRVVIFDEPTRGIDVAAKVEIYHLMNQLKQSGIAVLFVSSEMPEILGMSDRILVMCEGKITGELLKQEATQDKILAYATRFENKMDAYAGKGGDAI